MPTDVLHAHPVLPDIQRDPDLQPMCNDCLTVIPWDVASIAVGMGVGVVDVGGLREAFLPSDGGTAEVIACTHPAAPKPESKTVRAIECPECRGTGGDFIRRDEDDQFWLSCETCGGSGLVGILRENGEERIVPVNLSGSDTEAASERSHVRQAPKKTEFEKTTSRLAFMNWVNMRYQIGSEMDVPGFEFKEGGDDEPGTGD